MLKMLREKGGVFLEGMYCIKTLKLILFNTKCSCTTAPKSFFQDEECESCNEMLQHQILALYLSKMLLSRLLIDSGNTWQGCD